MSILCIICTDQLESEENLQSTRCGHIFHHHCLSHWIQTSNTCPQCRKVVTNRGLWRVYPTFSDEESGESAELQSTLDEALRELSLLRTACEEKDERLKHFTDTNNFSEEEWSVRFHTEQFKRQLECFKNKDLRRQLQLVLKQRENQAYQVDMLKLSLECSMNREVDLSRELHQFRQYSLVCGVLICIISATIGIFFYPYIYPIPMPPVQQPCWQKSVGFVSSYINRLILALNNLLNLHEWRLPYLCSLDGATVE